MQNMRNGAKTPRMGMEVIKGGMLGALVSVVLIFLYALALWKELLPAESIRLVNALIKVLSAAAAALFAVRRCARRRWLTGALTGLFYTLLAFMVFSVLSDTFVVSEALLSDLLIGLLSGMTAGAVRQLIGK